MGKFAVIMLIGIAGHLSCMAQHSRMKAYSDSLLFNLFTDHPDSSVCNFMETYIQHDYCHRPVSTDTVHGWNTDGKPPEKLLTPEVSIHTMLFIKHPFLKEKFSNGKLEIGISRFFKDDFFWGEVKLYLYFLNKEDAKNTYIQIRSKLSALAIKKAITNKTSGTEIALFTDELNNEVQLILVKDSIYDDYYYIMFRNR